MLAIEGARDRVHQDRERAEAPQATRLPQREDPLDPTIALRVVGALHQLAPEDGKPQRPLGPVVRGVHVLFHHKRPQSAQLAVQRAGKLSHIPSDLVVNGSSHMVRAAQPSICR
jgi:hypothetical protein